MSNALDFSFIYRTLINDTELKTLMNIPNENINNFRVLVDKYFLQTYVSDKFTSDAICRLLLRSGMQFETNNDFVKWNGVFIEIYIPKVIDIMEGFMTRTNLIAERIQKLLNRKYINDNKLYFISTYELIANSVYYKRHLCRFNYKKVYR